MRLFLFIVALLAGCAGVVIVVLGWTSNRDGVAQTGGAIAVAALVALTAVAGVKSWADERKRSREARRQEVYVSLIQQLMSRFGDNYDANIEAPMRVQVATWGSPQVVKALGTWHALYDQIMPSGVTGSVPLTSAQSQSAQNAIADVVLAIREELIGSGGVDRAAVVSALFNDSSKTVGR